MKIHKWREWNAEAIKINNELKNMVIQNRYQKQKETIMKKNFIKSLVKYE